MEIIKTEHELEIGKVYGNNSWEAVTNRNGDYKQVAFKVVSNASLDDYIKYLKTVFREEEIQPEWLEKRDYNFYFVLAD